MLIYKNTKWSTCAHILFVLKGTGHMFIDLGFVRVYWLLLPCRTHYSAFLDG